MIEERSSWDSKSAWQVLLDVDDVLRQTTVAFADSILVPVSMFWGILRYPTPSLMLRGRRVRRPARFTRKLGYEAPRRKTC
jgi:hypothetical protein